MFSSYITSSTLAAFVKVTVFAGSSWTPAGGTQPESRTM